MIIGRLISFMVAAVALTAVKNAVGTLQRDISGTGPRATPKGPAPV